MILFGKSNWKKARPFSNKDYQYSYEYFYALCQKNGIQMYRASYDWYDHKKHLFKHAWVYEGENANWKRVKNIRPDLIYDKTKARLEVYYKKELIRKKCFFINDLAFTRIIDDKLITSFIFDKWSKKSWLIENVNDLKEISRYIKSNKIVLKPISESGGKDIKIIEKRDISKIKGIVKPYIAQEFIDSSSGVPGISHTLHDLRLVCVNDKVVYSYIREPKRGSFLANLAQGGSLKIVPKELLPKSLSSIFRYANEIFATFDPRIYSIDFMFDKNKKPWIVELNSMPGLYFTPNEKPYMMEMYQELLKVFKKELNI